MHIKSLQDYIYKTIRHYFIFQMAAAVANDADSHQSTVATGFFDNIHGNVTSVTKASHLQLSSELWDMTTLETLNQTSSTAIALYHGKFDPALVPYTLFHIAYFLNRYYLWIVFAFGFPGNIVSFVTILRMKPFTSPTRYVATLAFVDNVCLVCKLLFLMLTKYDVHIGNKGCAALMFLGSFTAQFANWLLVAMTVERCLAICLPLKVGSICTR